MLRSHDAAPARSTRFGEREVVRTRQRRRTDRESVADGRNQSRSVRLRRGEPPHVSQTSPVRIGPLPGERRYFGLGPGGAPFRLTYRASNVTRHVRPLSDEASNVWRTVSVPKGVNVSF